MEMHQVRYFLAAAKSLSFTRAAEACHVSQPALTTAIKKLEADLGTPLFHRDGRQILLTEFGRRMQPHLTQLLEQAKAAENVAKDFRLLNQVPVRLGVMSTIGPMRVAAVLASFEHRSPGVEVAVRDGSPEALAAQLDADELDLAMLNPLDGLGRPTAASRSTGNATSSCCHPSTPCGSAMWWACAISRSRPMSTACPARCATW
ncbi:MAG: LysR family transcriptional regulator [Xanthobacteraceae bacterium]|nr:LysR family transcriptional regulator [Xanthobacteraceae bacterium]